MILKESIINHVMLNEGQGMPVEDFLEQCFDKFANSPMMRCNPMFQQDLATGMAQQHVKGMVMDFLRMDPTFDGEVCSKYSEWIGFHAVNAMTGGENPQYIEPAVQSIGDYVYVKNHQGMCQQIGIDPDINKYNFQTFVEAMQPIINDQQFQESKIASGLNKIRGQFEVLGNADGFAIIRLGSYKASQIFGSCSHWCTCCSSEKYSDYMNDTVDGLFVLIPIVDGKLDVRSDEKIQLCCFNGGGIECKDVDENDIDMSELPEGIQQFFADRWNLD